MNSPQQNPTVSSEQISIYKQQAMELACLVADTMSVSSWRKIHNNISAVDKEVIRLLRCGYEKTGAKTAHELVQVISQQEKKSEKKLENIDNPEDLFAYDVSESNLVAENVQRMRELFVIPEVREWYLSEFSKRKPGFEMVAKGQEGNSQVEKKRENDSDCKDKKISAHGKKIFQGCEFDRYGKE